MLRVHRVAACERLWFVRRPVARGRALSQKIMRSPHSVPRNTLSQWRARGGIVSRYRHCRRLYEVRCDEHKKMALRPNRWRRPKDKRKKSTHRSSIGVSRGRTRPSVVPEDVRGRHMSCYRRLSCFLHGGALGHYAAPSWKHCRHIDQSKLFRLGLRSTWTHEILG